MVLAIIGISLYIGIRAILQVWIPRGNMSIKKGRVALGVIWLPLQTIVYLTEVLNYMAIWTPSTWALPPMPIEIFLIWIVFVVADILYQYRIITILTQSNP